VLLLIVVAVGSYYAARFLLECWPRRRRQPPYTRPLCPDDDDEFLAELAHRPKKPDEPS
jgi:hypothetical protein